MSSTLKIEGFAALDAAMKDWPVKFRNKLMKPAMKFGMETVVLREAKRQTPKDSGDLAKSLKVRAAKLKGNKRLPRGVVGFQVQTVKTKKIDAWYAGFVFLGAHFRHPIKRSKLGRPREGTMTLRRALHGKANELQRVIFGKVKSGFAAIAREVYAQSSRFKG